MGTLSILPELGEENRLKVLTQTRWQEKLRIKMKNMRWTRKQRRENKGTSQTEFTDTAQMKKRIRLKYQKRTVRRFLEHCELAAINRRRLEWCSYCIDGDYENCEGAVGEAQEEDDKRTYPTQYGGHASS
ncbi:hypothetical protein A2U01_0051661 [Trifolium medium]|uniref:Uncharacterized protein n=1 Tax=Trifolium medium TaxID=97028 RepID=A0A392R2Y6_9FABA|nr:hypothetical protein [Trifolium medium]